MCGLSHTLRPLRRRRVATRTAPPRGGARPCAAEQQAAAASGRSPPRDGSAAGGPRGGLPGSANRAGGTRPATQLGRRRDGLGEGAPACRGIIIGHAPYINRLRDSYHRHCCTHTHAVKGRGPRRRRALTPRATTVCARPACCAAMATSASHPPCSCTTSRAGGARGAWQCPCIHAYPHHTGHHTTQDKHTTNTYTGIRSNVAAPAVGPGADGRRRMKCKSTSGRLHSSTRQVLPGHLPPLACHGRWCCCHGLLLARRPRQQQCWCCIPGRRPGRRVGTLAPPAGRRPQAVSPRPCAPPAGAADPLPPLATATGAVCRARCGW